MINRNAKRTTGRILSKRKMGAYFHLVLQGDGIGKGARPGNFVAVSVGGEHSSMVLHRVFAIYRVRSDASAIEIIVANSGKGTQWLIEQTEGSEIVVTGPLGSAFPLPAEPLNVAIIGGGYGAAPLFELAEQLKNRGCRVDAIIGASTGLKVFAPLEGKRTVNSLLVTTDDGSAGKPGRVTDFLPELIERERIDLIYSCGPMAMLSAVDAIARSFDISHQVSVEEAMACGIGICMTCVLPMYETSAQDGEVAHMKRTCIEGPVIDSERIAWSRFKAVGSE